MTVTRRSGHHAGVAGSPAGGAAVPAAAASFAAAAAPSSSASQPPPQQQEATAVLPTPPAVVMTAPKKGTSSSNSKQASSARRQSAAPSSLALDGPATLAHPLAPNSQQGAAAGASAAATAASQSTSSSGAVTIEDAAVDALIEQPFPRKSHAKALQPKDQQDELLMFCARAVACCGNRALTPKEIAAIASRKWNWACSGTQPFAVISSCIRAHLRRAEKAKPPYPAMFRSYELTSVPPPEDIPCLGIEPEARPVVKRGTFWFLTEAMGFQSPFQHRLGEEILGSNVGGKDGSDGKGQATLSATSSGASLGNDNSVTEGTAPSALTASLLAQGQTPTTKTAKEEKPLTRAQKAQLGTGISAPPVVFQHQLIAPAPAPGTIPLATTAPAAGPTARKEGSAVDTLGRGKRKRTASQAVNKLSTAGATQNHLPPVAGGPVVGGARPPQAGSSTPTSAVVSATASTAPQAKDTGVHRRALSSSASDTSKPSFSGFRKLKFRLSALSELPSPNASPFVKKTASAPRATGPCPPAASAQPLSKRQRTQSMSQLSSSTSFPFDNLLHGLSSSLHSRPEAGHRANTHVVPTPHGTIHPLDIHNLHISPAPSSLYPSASPHHFDSLASRSAPDNNIFSPPLQTTSHVSGPFSRSHSPSSYFNKIRSAHTAESDAPSPASYAGEAESVTPYGGVDMMDLSREYDGWSAGHRSLTDSAILAAQRELTGAASSSAAEAQHLSDYHEAMLKSDLDLDFDFSLNSLRESSVIKEDLAASAQDALSIAVDVTSATPDEEEEESFQMDLGESGHLDSELDGVFDGLSPGGAEGVEDSAMAEVSAAHTQMTEEEFEDDGEEDIEGLDSAVLPGLGARRSKSLAESIARHRALSTTLCPAAGKTRADSSKSVRPIARRINSKSNLAFPKLSVSGDGLSTPRLRPSTISRTNSRHVLTTPVPLVELPSIPLLSSSDLVYKLHSDADSHDKDRARFSEDGDSRVAFTPNIKAEEEDAENAFNVDVDGDEASSLLPPAARSASTSRSSSVESATDPFRPEAYVRAASMASSSATAVNEGTLEAVAARSIPRSRSQSSSRRTSLSPRDSFSPQASGPHADWALTPPSEEEAMMEDEEKNLDRATLLGPESVDVEEFDDVWPYSFGEFRQRLDERVSDTDVAESAQQVESIPTATAADQQLSCSTSGAGIFEPILAAAPLPPQAEAAPVFSQHITASLTESSVTGDAMAVDQQPARPRSRTVTANLPPVFMRSNGKTRNTGDGRASNTPSPITAALPSHRPIWPAPANSTSLPQQKGMSARLSAADSGSAAAPAATQSFLFQPETPFDPPINILLTEKKVLFYQTCVAGSSSSLATFPMPLLPRGLLRRVDNDAVEVDALVAICAAADPEMKDTCMEKLQQVKADGNTWVDIVAARAIVAACGRGSQLDDFLADDILLAWNDKLQKLGVWLRSKNGLKFPVGAAHSATAFTRSSSSVCPSPPTPTAASAMLPTDKLPASASRPRSVQPSLSPRVRSRKVSSSLAAAPTVAVDAVVIPAETAEDSKLDAARPSHPSLPEAPLKVDTRSAVQPVKAAPKTPRAGTGKAPSPVSTNTPGPTSASTRRSARNKNAA